MSDHVRWIERSFSFNFPAGLYPELTERLRGTPARVEELARSAPPSIITRRHRDDWSIQEHIGHLADLEELFLGRLEDFEAEAETLRPADMSNRKTHEANHNQRSLPDVLTELRSKREGLVARLERLPAAMFERSAFHERLDTKMRLVDMLYFHAEHDDFHLARMRWLLHHFAR